MTTTLSIIEESICEYFDISYRQMFKNRRVRYWVSKRQMFFFLSRQYTKLSFRTIGAHAGRWRGKDFDHATVLHGCNLIKDQLDIETDRKLRKTTEQIEGITRLIREKTYQAPGLILTDINLLGMSEKYTQSFIAV